MLSIGVRLPRRFEDAGEYLADARALDAAGVDSLWLDEDTGCEPWLILAGIAALGGRARLVVPVSGAECRAPLALQARAETLDRLSRRRATLALTDAPGDAESLAAVVEVARRAGCGVLLHAMSGEQARLAARLADGLAYLGGTPDAFRVAVEPLARQREAAGLDAPFHRWAAIKMPVDRDEWRRVRLEYEAAGASGVIVPTDPRLLDLLRNGDEEDDRSDLTLAQG